MFKKITEDHNPNIIINLMEGYAQLYHNNLVKNNDVLDLVSKSFIIEWDDDYVNRSGTTEYLKCDDIPKAINEFIKENPDCTITAVK